MLTRNLQPALFATLILLVAASCANPTKLLERGNYDGAVELSARKLSGKKKKKAKYVRALEAGFDRANASDLRQAKVLEKEGQAENWVEINRLHQRIRKRQELIEPLLPLYADDGYKADFRFVRIEGLELESKEKAANFFYIEGKRLLAEAERGDKAAGRRAWDEFDKIGRYYRRYRDEDRLMQRALELGRVYVLFKMENRSHAILPRDFEREIRRLSVADLESQWRTVHLNPENGLKYDYHVVMNLRQIDVSPSVVKEREYVDDQTIEDGWEYVLDANGNVVKDTAGNDVKVPRKVVIKALVFETLQQKSAIVSGHLEFYDVRLREVVHSQPMTAEAIFENYAATFQGDKRALSEASKRKIGNRPLPFPTDEALVLQAAEQLKPFIKKNIARSRLLI